MKAERTQSSIKLTPAQAIKKLKKLRKGISWGRYGSTQEARRHSSVYKSPA